LKNGYILFSLRFTKEIASLLNQHYPKSESTTEDDVHQHFEQISTKVQSDSAAEKKILNQFLMQIHHKHYTPFWKKMWMVLETFTGF